VRAGPDPLVAEPVEHAVDLADQVGRVDHLEVGAIELRPVDLQGTVEIKRDLPVVAHQRERLAFQDAEIGRIAQVIVLPGIAVDHQQIEPGLRHGVDEARAALLREPGRHGGKGDGGGQNFTGTNLSL
jgi:hypothetical protein